MSKSKIILGLILVTAFVLRFYQLGVVPLSLDWDEVSNSYNAYSILKTGRDEYGNFLPLTNRSFDDFKPPLYMYLEVPAVLLFGLNNFSARLPSAIAGLISVLFVYFLTKQLFKKEKLALVAAAFFAIEPWTSHFSRVGFEANIGLFFTLGTFAFLLYSFNENIEFKKRKTLLLLSSIFFVLSIYSYHSTRIFVPLLSITTTIIYKNELFAFSKKYLIALFMLIFFLLLPIIIFTPKGSFANRLEATTQKAITQDLNTSVNLIQEDNLQHQQLSKFIHNRRIIIAQSTFQKYLSHFDVNYLFIIGDDNFRHHIEQYGLLFLFQLPLFIIGLYVAVKKHTKNHLFTLSWLILAPVPASLGDAFPHAIRSYNMVLPITIVSSIGLAFLLSKVTSKNIKYSVVIVCALIACSFFAYTHDYFNHYKVNQSAWWQYGYKEAVVESEKLKANFNKVVIDSSLEQSYIFWLYYRKYDPRQYQLSKDKNHFGKYEFGIDNATDSRNLYVSLAGKFPSDYVLLKTISDPTGTPIIKIGYKNN